MYKCSVKAVTSPSITNRRVGASAPTYGLKLPTYRFAPIVGQRIALSIPRDFLRLTLVSLDSFHICVNNYLTECLFVTLNRSPDCEQSEQEGASEGVSLFVEFTLSEGEGLRMTN